MQWLAIATLIAKVIEAIAPAIEECLNDRLERASHQLPPPDTFGSEGAAATALLDKAIEMTRPRNVFVRIGLRHIKSNVVEGDKIRSTPLTKDEIAEGRSIVGAILRSID